jgi:hypothetical protein
MEELYMKIEHFVEEMGESLLKVEESVEKMKMHTIVNKTEQLQMMQAILELSERIKWIEIFMLSRHY